MNSRVLPMTRLFEWDMETQKSQMFTVALTYSDSYITEWYTVPIKRVPI